MRQSFLKKHVPIVPYCTRNHFLRLTAKFIYVRVFLFGKTHLHEYGDTVHGISDGAKNPKHYRTKGGGCSSLKKTLFGFLLKVLDDKLLLRADCLKQRAHETRNFAGRAEINDG